MDRLASMAVRRIVVVARYSTLAQSGLSDSISHTRIVGRESLMSKPSWWSRRGQQYTLLVLSFGTVDFAIRHLLTVFGWRQEPADSSGSQVFEYAVILMTGVYVLTGALRRIVRQDADRAKMLKEFHEKAVHAKEQGSPHA